MAHFSIKPTNILVPSVSDMTAFACIACDQFTGEPEYWKKLENLIDGKNSAYNLVLPEIYLDEYLDKRIEIINSNIASYLKQGVFREYKDGFVLTVRQTPFVKRRIGLVCAIDLDNYDYSKNSTAFIRASEGTIEERIPPRLKIRRNASAEFPHVMVLFDDEKKEITEELYEHRNEYEKIYDFDLNMGGGHIEGYFIPNSIILIEKFTKLLNSERLIEKYGKDDKLAMVVGDGNHSLATAKALWNETKKNTFYTQRENHPLKYALVELVNIYDEGIYFEPIYRFVYEIDREKFVAQFKNLGIGKCQIFDGDNLDEILGQLSLPDVIQKTDDFIKEFIANNGGKVDYIHGEKNIKTLVKARKDAVGILFDKLDKKELFKYVSENGPFPRKTFSMGEGVEKRYYLEGRKLK